MHKCWPRGFLRQERAGISLLWLTGRYLLVEGLYYIARSAAFCPKGSAAASLLATVLWEECGRIYEN